jgi:hypothetical protein
VLLLLIGISLSVASYIYASASNGKWVVAVGMIAAGVYYLLLDQADRDELRRLKQLAPTPIQLRFTQQECASLHAWVASRLGNNAYPDLLAMLASGAAKPDGVSLTLPPADWGMLAMAIGRTLYGWSGEGRAHLNAAKHKMDAAVSGH